MKNIWVLESDEPTKILKTISKGNFIFAKSPTIGINWENYHIYITYAHFVQENDFVINTLTNRIIQYHGNQVLDSTWKTIVLTTDETLIKQGVQKIDDEFLNWWVNNSSCEYVDLRYDLISPIGRKVDSMDVSQNHSQCTWKYKIIIPQEKPTLDVIAFKSEEYVIKRESVQEAAENYALELFSNNTDEAGDNIESFKEGARWMFDRCCKYSLYSSEIMYKIIYGNDEYL